MQILQGEFLASLREFRDSFVRDRFPAVLRLAMFFLIFTLHSIVSPQFFYTFSLPYSG